MKKRSEKLMMNIYRSFSERFSHMGLHFNSQVAAVPDIL